ncbi:hypothetical protein HMI54_010622, partial [Coelomomyces lativittatus]
KSYSITSSLRMNTTSPSSEHHALSHQLKQLHVSDASKTTSASSSVQIGIEVKKAEDPAKWYTQVLLRSEMMDYSDISGCYILRPWSYGIWERIQAYLNHKLMDSGVENGYFPMFVSQRALEREKNHIEGFAPEVAWVTKAGTSDLAEPIAIRPTSETVMYPSFAKWIQSYRDLPFRMNQWCNIVRWEFKHPQPFLRTREFLWQEGHTAFLTQHEADLEVLEILKYYQDVYEDLLCIPVIPGKKSEKEKFAGGDYTTTIEAFVPVTGRGIQAATSHGLGQNFAKMFNIQLENEMKQKQYVWQNSWGLTTRTIGIMVMVHGDDKGLVLPPKVAQLQVILIPCGITVKTTTEGRQAIHTYLKDIVKELKDSGIRCKLDDRDMYSPGYKFNHWELRGVPIRLEAGPRDVQQHQVVLVRRDTGTKQSVSRESIANTLQTLLHTIHHDMLAKAKEARDQQMTVMEAWEEEEEEEIEAGSEAKQKEENPSKMTGNSSSSSTQPKTKKNFVQVLDQKHLVLAPWCTTPSCEESIKARSSRSSISGPKGDEAEEDDEKAPSMGAKSLCIPFEQPKPVKENTPCFATLQTLLHTIHHD